MTGVVESLIRVVRSKTVALVFAALGGEGWMRFFVRERLIPFDPEVGCCCVVIGTMVASIAAWRWHRSAPYHFAIAVGLCGGIAGAGLVMMLSCLVTPYFGGSL